MVNPKELLNNWQKETKEYEEKEKKLDSKIELRKNQLKRLEKRKNKLKYPHWINLVLKPLGYEIEKKLKGYKFDDNLLTFGLNCQCPLIFEKGNEKTLMITFKPTINGLAIVNHNDIDESYDKNSIGALNGFQYGSLEFNENTTIDWLINFMQN